MQTLNLLSLFGSAARGDATEHSEIDTLVVKGGIHIIRRLALCIHENFVGVGQAVDIIVATPDDLEQYANCEGLVYRTVLQEGRVIYEREGDLRALREGPNLWDVHLHCSTIVRS